MTLPENPADREWIVSRMDRLAGLEPEARALFLKEIRAERPDLAPCLESLLNAPTETLHLPVGKHPLDRHAFACGDVIAGRYRVRSCVGSGGMGEVYEVEDTHMPERGAIALKTVRGDLLGKPDIVARFEREVRHALELAHPNVCRIYDVSRHSGTESSYVPGGRAPAGAGLSSDVLFLTMEFLSGGTLAKWMDGPDGRPRAVPESEALPLIRQMTAGLAAIHGQRVIHRDFKPLNVMLVPSGSITRAVITDLGLARTFRDTIGSDGDLTLTRTGAAPGTPAYMAPELIAGAPASCASDVYSLGVTILEMLTASRSGVADPGKALRAASISAQLSAITAKCLARDPADRYRDAGEVNAALDPKPALRRLPLRTAALMLLGLSLAAGGFYWWNTRVPTIPDEARNWYTRGVDDMQSGSYYAAAKKFQEATRLAPDFAMAHVRLAEAWFGLEGRNLANAEMLKVTGRLTQEEQDYREAVRLTFAGEYDKAVESFRTFAAHASDAHAGQLALALALERAGHGPEARGIYAGLTSVYPWANLRLAMIDARKGDWPKANPEFDSALGGFRKANNAEGETETLYQRGFLSIPAVKLDDARRLLNEVMDRVQLTHNVYQQIRAQIDLCTVELYSVHMDEAITLATQAMQSATDNGVEVMYSRANRSLGNAYSKAGEYGKAEPLLKEALRLARQDSDTRLEAAALTLLSDLHSNTGHLSDAAGEAEKALALYTKQNNPNQIVQAARAAANAYRDLGEFTKAATLANEALNAATTVKSDGLTGQAFEATGQIELSRQRYSEAVNDFRQALAANTRAKAAAYIQNENVLLGAALGALGQFAEAERLLDSAEKLAEGREDLLNNLRIVRAEVEIYRGDARAAQRMVANVRPDPADPGQAADLALVADAAQSGSPAMRAQMLLKLNQEGVSFGERRQIHLAAALDLYRARDSAAAATTLGSPGDYSEMAEAGWRALLLASHLSGSGDASALRRQASDALTAGAPFLGYTSIGHAIGDKTSSTRLDLRDELRELTTKGSGR